MRPTEEWLALYERKRRLLFCQTDLNAYFSADEIAGKKLDRLQLGSVSLPSGAIIVCDPLVYLDETAAPYFQSVPPGEYAVTLAVLLPEDDDCARYAAARVKFTESEADEDDDLYTDYFAGLLAQSAESNPAYQREGGDWLNWRIPGTDYHIPIFASGFGDGYYPVWFGYDANGGICSLVVQFIDIKAAYGEEKE
ncbi:MAG: DUF4241 domain-containing protein [Deltaproteobacteria bacterium]|jgi:hypothetical protein|nr:DUF4241 domain-containing protein [Deltaproteobacteria bacterium]